MREVERCLAMIVYVENIGHSQTNFKQGPPRTLQTDFCLVILENVFLRIG